MVLYCGNLRHQIHEFVSSSPPKCAEHATVLADLVGCCPPLELAAERGRGGNDITDIQIVVTRSYPVEVVQVPEGVMHNRVAHEGVVYVAGKHGLVAWTDQTARRIHHHSEQRVDLE